jgi:hypothetical protein
MSLSNMAPPESAPPLEFDLSLNLSINMLTLLFNIYNSKIYNLDLKIRHR